MCACKRSVCVSLCSATPSSVYVCLGRSVSVSLCFSPPPLCVHVCVRVHGHVPARAGNLCLQSVGITIPPAAHRLLQGDPPLQNLYRVQPGVLVHMASHAAYIAIIHPWSCLIIRLICPSDTIVRTEKPGGPWCTGPHMPPTQPCHTLGNVCLAHKTSKRHA